MPTRSRFDARWAAPLVTALTFVLVCGAATAQSAITFGAADAADGDLFGVSVDIVGATVVVGASSTDVAREDAGAAYVFGATPDGIVERARLVASDGELADAFGAAVAVSEDAIVVGAPGVILSELNEGAAYLFERTDDGWREAARVHRDAPGRNDMFGGSVDLDDGVAVVGAPGADVGATDTGVALAYERVGGAWTRTATLTPDDARAGDRFGAAVAVHGERILVGASGNVPEEDTPGAAYVFERASGGWRQAARLVPTDGVGGDAFGDAVALHGDLAVVGARFADRAGRDDGAAYVFQRSGDGWVARATLAAPEPADRDQFGRAVAIAGEAVLVGAPRVDTPERDAGAVWAFTAQADGWSLAGRRSPEAAGAYDEFGSALAADADRVVVGAPQDIPAGADGEVVTGTATLLPAP